MSAVFAADAVIAGAGVIGIAVARHFRAANPAARLVIISPHAPMGYTSALSTECFRDHWPSRHMSAFMARSIQLLAARADLTRRGYLFVSRGSDDGGGGGDAVAAMRAEAEACHGAAAVRVVGPGAPPAGGDPRATLYSTPAAVAAAFPYLAPATAAALHVHNAGWLSAHTMGMSMWEELAPRPLREDGGERLAAGETVFVRGEVAAIDAGPQCNRVSGVRVVRASAAGTSHGGVGAGAGARGGGSGRGAALHIAAPVVVNAAGPHLNVVHRRHFAPSPSTLTRPHNTAAVNPAATTVGGATTPHDLPVYSEIHAKSVLRDVLRVVPRDAPMVICNDAITLQWSEEELAYLQETTQTHTLRKLTEPLAPGVHFRPYGGANSDAVLMLGECWHHQLRGDDPPADSVDAVLDHAWYPEVLVRALSQVVPDLAAYFHDDAYQALMRRRGLDPGAAGGGPPGIKAVVDGGHYTKTAENVPLLGPSPGPCGRGLIEGSYLAGAVSGYGIMAAQAAGELVAAYMSETLTRLASGRSLPSGPDAASTSAAYAATLPPVCQPYALSMSPLRHQDPAFIRPGGLRDVWMAAGGGQL